MSTRRTITRTDGALLAWAQHATGLILDQHGAFGVTQAFALQFQDRTKTFAAAMAACEPAVRNKVSVAIKNNARAELRTEVARLISLVEGAGTVSDAQKVQLGLLVRQGPTRAQVPESSPVVTVRAVTGRTVSLRLRSSEIGRGKPAGALGASIFYATGDAPPTERSEWRFLNNTGRTDLEVAFTQETTAGTVWLTAFWFNGRKESGPSCPPVRINLPAVSPVPQPMRLSQAA